MTHTDLTILDFHAHFPVENTIGLENPPERHPLLKAYAEARSGRMGREWSTEPNENAASSPDEIDAMTERWADEVARYGLKRINFVTGRSNDLLASIVAKHPERFVGFAHHALRPGACNELKRAVDDLGLKGYKLIGPLTEYPFEHPDLRTVWEFCAERKLPVLIHFGWLGRGGGIVSHPRLSPLSLFETARDFPEIPFVIPHFGVNHWDDVLALCWSLPNILIDTSGSNQWMKWMPYPLTLEDLFRKAHENLGADRILFGTDSSLFPRGFSVRYLQDQLRACYSLNFREEDIRLIFGGNAARLLGIDLGRERLDGGQQEPEAHA